MTNTTMISTPGLSGTSVTMRSYFSLSHLQSAIHMANECLAIEKQCVGKYDNKLHPPHKAYSVSCVMSSVAFLEATINEFFSHPERFNCLSKDEITKVSALYAFFEDAGSKDLAILEKYQLILKLTNKKPLDIGAKIFQDAQALIVLRNAITHYKLYPRMKSISIEGKFNEPKKGKKPQNRLEKMEMDLEKRFRASPFFPAHAGNPFFPDRCFGYGCSKWAIESAIKFTDEFFSAFQILAPEYFHLKTNLPKLPKIPSN